MNTCRNAYVGVVVILLAGLCAGPVIADGNPTAVLTHRATELSESDLTTTAAPTASNAGAVLIWEDNPAVASMYGAGLAAPGTLVGGSGVVVARPPDPTGLISGVPPSGVGSAPAWAPVGEANLSEPGGAPAPPLQVLPAPGAVILGIVGVGALAAYQRRRA